MGWTYDPEDLTTNLNRVRLMIGDTDEADPRLSDEEIEYLLTAFGGVGQASVQSARAIAAQYAVEVDKVVGDLRISASQKFKHYVELVTVLESIAAVVDPAGVYLGGLVHADEDSDDADSTITHPRMKVGMHDYDGGSSLDPLRGDI